MYAIGQRIKHIQTRKMGTIEMFNQTFFPTINRTYYQLLVRGDDGREWICPGRQVEVIE